MYLIASSTYVLSCKQSTKTSRSVDSLSYTPPSGNQRCSGRAMLLWLNSHVGWRQIHACKGPVFSFPLQATGCKRFLYYPQYCTCNCEGISWALSNTQEVFFSYSQCLHDGRPHQVSHGCLFFVDTSFETPPLCACIASSSGRSPWIESHQSWLNS